MYARRRDAAQFRNVGDEVVDVVAPEPIARHGALQRVPAGVDSHRDGPPQQRRGVRRALAAPRIEIERERFPIDARRRHPSLRLPSAVRPMAARTRHRGGRQLRAALADDGRDGVAAAARSADVDLLSALFGQRERRGEKDRNDHV